jgi:hypothetical protein
MGAVNVINERRLNMWDLTSTKTDLLLLAYFACGAIVPLGLDVARLQMDSGRIISEHTLY